MTFTNPVYLWALSALAIPVAIHLLSRKEGRVIRVGSLRHVEESNTSQFKSIRPNEILLFALRALMFSVVVLFLAGAQCSSTNSTSRRWIVLEPGVESIPTYQNTIDSLMNAGYERHFLAVGFPTERPTRDTELDYRGLANQLGAMPLEVIVLSWSMVENFRGPMTPLPPNTRWIPVEHPEVTYAAYAQQAGDSLITRTARSSSTGTLYISNLEGDSHLNFWNDSVVIDRPATTSIHVFADNQHQELKQVFLGAIAVLQKEFRLPLKETTEGATADWTFWLSEARPKLAGTGHVAMLDPDGKGPVFEQKSPNVWAIQGISNRGDAVAQNLVLEMYRMMYPYSEKVLSKDVRTIPEAMAFTEPLTSTQLVSSKQDLASALVAIFLLTLAVERWLALKRNQ